MASGVPLTARTLAHSHQNDLQRTANPRLEINERRLRPIYDQMEIHNYRKALTEIERLLKKQANFTACKALKCLVLLKLDRHEEARALAKELEDLASSSIRTAPPGDASNVDENALTFLSQYYKDLREFHKVVSLYESATKREPTSEELLCSLFMSYVRVKDYKNQVLIAQKLYKLTRKIPYYNWAVISVLLQIDENSRQLKQTLYIPMTLKMLEKEFFDDNLQQQTKVFGEIECLLYLHTLELKEDFSKALQFLTKHLDSLTKSPSNESMLPVYFSHEKFLIYNYKAKNFEKTYQLTKEYLKEDNYLWNWYEVLFDTFFQFDQDKQKEFIEDFHQFILTTPDGVTDLRNIHLSRLELGLRWQIYQQKNSSITLPSLAQTYLSESYFEHIKFYIQTYSLKTTGVVMFDIYRLFEYLSQDQQKHLHQYLIEQFTTECSNIQYLINILYCSRLCGKIHQSWLKENHQSIVKRLFNQSNSTSDFYLIFINLLDELNESNIDLYNLLDHIYEKDSTHFDIKLYLYKFALIFNCPSLMKDYFDRLEIKNIQYFSLSYLLTDHYLRIHRNYRHMKNFFHYLTNLLLVYTDDSWNQIMFCYKYGNFLRINEIRTFADQYLNYSLIYIQGLIGELVVQLISNGNRYQTIQNLFQLAIHECLFEKKGEYDRSLEKIFSEYEKIQDTRDFDIWSKIDYRRLRFDETIKPIETLCYVDRILSENANEKLYQSPSYKDAFLRENQSNDFQQRIQVNHLRSNILQLLYTIYHHHHHSETTILLPNEEIFNRLKFLLNNQDNLTKSLTSKSMITPCEWQTIVDLGLYQTIPLLIQILTEGLTIKSSETKLSLENTTIHFEKIKQLIETILQQLKKSYKLVEKTFVQENFELFKTFSGIQSPLEYYSVYTEFISYIYCFYLSIKSIFATLFNKTSLLIDSNENSTGRTSNTKKSKKKTNEQQTIANESEEEIQLWNQFEIIEECFNQQWTNICENIHKFEQFVRIQGKLTNDECEKLEKDLDTTNDQQSNRSKSKYDANNNSEPIKEPTEIDLTNFQFGVTPMRSSTVHSFAIGYLETLIQIRVCLTAKQKTLRLRRPTTTTA